MSENFEKKMVVSISHKNSKMGEVPSVSLPPIVTCAKGCPCAKKCYAAKLCRIRKTVRDAYARNLDILNTDRAEYFRQVEFAASMARYFRWHVSGDIVDYDYFERMIAVIKSTKGTEHLCFTKRYDIVNAWLDKGNELPENLHILFSGWGDEWAVPNPHNLPKAEVVFKGEEPKENWKVCGGNCTTCACRGVGCWNMKKGDIVCFKEH